MFWTDKFTFDAIPASVLNESKIASNVHSNRGMRRICIFRDCGGQRRTQSQPSTPIPN